MKPRAYIYLPEEDNDFLRIGDSSDDYYAIIKSIRIIVEVLEKLDAELWFDPSNLTRFADKSNLIVDGKYLNNIKNQLRRVLGKIAYDINTSKASVDECVYMKWNSDFSHSDIGILLKEAAESAIVNNEAITILIIVSEAISCERSTFNVIKDASHFNDLPVLVRIPLFNDEYELSEWASSVIEQTEFSLRNKDRFQATGKKWIKQMIYQEKETGNLWYYDFYHRQNKQHFEVFDKNGDHIGEATLGGDLIPDTKDDKKKIKFI